MFSALGEITSGMKCTSVGCYSYQNPGVHELFRQLQAGLNKYAAELKFSPLDVDGVIGQKSLLAAQKVGPKLAGMSVVPTNIVNVLGVTLGSVQELAKNADVWVDALKRATGGITVPSAGTRVTTVKTADTKIIKDPATGQNMVIDPATGIPVPAGTNASGSGKFEFTRNKKIGLAVALAAIGAYVWHKRKQGN